MDEKNLIKVLLCGTGFGKVYLNAINSMDNYKLAGILGRGNRESISLSTMYKVPYYTNVDEIEEAFDLACVIVPNKAFGGDGSQIARKLLQKGIPTLLEHPAHKNEIIECLKVSNHTNFLVNPFYRFTETYINYIELLDIIRANSVLLNASLECSINVLYSGLDMLCLAIKNIDKYIIHSSMNMFDKEKGKAGQSTSFVSMSIGKTPVFLKINREVDVENKDNPMHLYHRIELTFDSGRLLLLNTNGPIVWLPFIDTQFNGDVINGVQRIFDFPTSIIFDCNNTNSIRETVEVEWVNAAERAMKKTLKQETSEKHAFLQFQLFISELWSNVSKEIGYTNIKDLNINKNSMDITNNLISRHKSIGEKNGHM